MFAILAPPIFALGLPHGSEWLLLFLLFVLLAPIGSIFWIWALVSCIRNESSADNTKVVWTLIIAVLHVLGALLYFLVRRPERIRELGR